MIATAEPNVLIEEQREGYVRYQRLNDAGAVTERWEVHGTCDRRGDCLIGAVIDGVQIRDHAHLAELAAAKKGRIDSDLDVPITTGFLGCCPLEVVEL